jgi:hypothetical protein
MNKDQAIMARLPVLISPIFWIPCIRSKVDRMACFSPRNTIKGNSVSKAGNKTFTWPCPLPAGGLKSFPCKAEGDIEYGFQSGASRSQLQIPPSALADKCSDPIRLRGLRSAGLYLWQQCVRRNPFKRDYHGIIRDVYFYLF